mmetsp:Transcript_1519/g.1828  ORF Transcript_1519/g.1828 Transcript_1519/m.1828 type:complete len:92 (+) Transcript_1519:103-378(+)
MDHSESAAAGSTHDHHDHEEERMYHTWTEFFLEPVPLTICTISILFFLGWYDVLAICAAISLPFVLAFLHTVYEKLTRTSSSNVATSQKVD